MMMNGLNVLTGRSYMSIEKQVRSVAPGAASAAGQNTGEVTGKDFAAAMQQASTKDYSDSELDSIFERASKEYDVPLELLKAVAKAESDFNSSSVSSSGAVGIMQLMPETAKGLGVANSYDAEQNIMGGAKYLSLKLEEFDGDISLALAAYNAGSGAVKKYGGIPPYKETQGYVKKILGYLENGF